MENEYKSLRDYIASSQRQQAALDKIVHECEAKGNKEEAEHYADRSKMLFIEMQALQMLQTDLQDKANNLIEKFEEEYRKSPAPERKNDLVAKLCEDIRELF